MLYAIVAVLAIIVDQWVKYWVQGNIAFETGVREFIPGVLSLVNVHNTGAAMGLFAGDNAKLYLIIVCLVFVVAVIIALATKLVSGWLGRWCLVFIMAGGISNCIDRIIYGYVQDMFMTEFVDFYIFNVADIFITVFCLIFVLYILFGGENKDRRERRKEYEDDEDEYDYDEEEEEERKPSRKSAKEEKPSPKAQRAAFSRLNLEDDEQEEEEPDDISQLKEHKPTRKERQAKYDDEYARFKASRAERKAAEQPAEETKPRTAALDPSDPFAEWERANAKVEARNKTYIGQQPKTEPAPKSVEKPKAASAPKADSDEFSLEDILAEFK